MCHGWITTALGSGEGHPILKNILKTFGPVRQHWTKAWATRPVTTSPLPRQIWKGVAKWNRKSRHPHFHIIANHSTTQSLSFRDQRIFGRWFVILGNLRGVTRVFQVQLHTISHKPRNPILHISEPTVEKSNCGCTLKIWILSYSRAQNAWTCCSTEVIQAPKGAKKMGEVG